MISFRVANDVLPRKTEAAKELLATGKIYVDGPFVDSEGETVFGRCEVCSYGSHSFSFEADGGLFYALNTAVEYFIIEGELKTF